MSLKNNLKISIIVPSYNRADLIVETLHSIQAQINPNWECIIVDDGSTDNTKEILNKFLQDEKIRFLQRDRTPKGAPTCRNLGAQVAIGDYLVFLDSDDLISPDFLDKRLIEIEKNKSKDFIVFPSGFFIKKIGDDHKIWNIINKKEDDLKRFFNGDTPWHTTGPIWKKESFLSIGGFRERTLSGQDWEIHVKALIKGLNYSKVKDSILNLNHFIRNDDHQSITSDFLSKEQILNRLEMYKDILLLLVKNKKTLELIKLNVIKYFYQTSIMSIELGLNKEAINNLYLLKRHKVISFMLYYILKQKLVRKDFQFIYKFLDSLLFRIYKLKNLEFPESRTKGILESNKLPYYL